MTDFLAKGLSVRLGERNVLIGVDVAFARGSLSVLIGPNGSGKTSLLRALLRLVPIEGGSVVLQGEDITLSPPSALAGRISYLPQERQVHWPMRLDDLVRLGRMGEGRRFERPSAEDREACRRAIRDCGLAGFEDRRVDALSGGEKARALLARTLASDAPFLLADEPVASLDPHHQLAVMEVLKAEARKGRGVVTVMHDLSLAARFADHLVLLCEGKVLGSGAADEVLDARLIEQAFRVRSMRDELGGIIPLARL